MNLIYKFLFSVKVIEISKNIVGPLHHALIQIFEY